MSDVIFSSTTNELISVSKDGMVIFWDLVTGEKSRSIDISTLSPGRNTRLYQSPDGRSLIVDCDALDSPVHVYDMKTMRLLYSVGVRLPTQQRGFLSGNLLCRQKSIIDVARGVEVRTIDDFACTKAYVPCAISSDGASILIGDETEVTIKFIIHPAMVMVKVIIRPIRKPKNGLATLRVCCESNFIFISNLRIK